MAVEGIKYPHQKRWQASAVGLSHHCRTLGQNLILILGSLFNPHEISCQSKIQSSVD